MAINYILDRSRALPPSLVWVVSSPTRHVFCKQRLLLIQHQCSYFLDNNDGEEVVRRLGISSRGVGGSAYSFAESRSLTSDSERMVKY
ncbi:hypothetical protein JTE90_009525 [Oedothorax gibbosus]|uniref:Uncharacterized protein n=1 Tax=Oedothorax gibbosus TaxID=931172 RepID=A0AAV6UTC3_9ARAC|nr:hypothetical protein JTE90_009525 [Oedothorax gibbosus]